MRTILCVEDELHILENNRKALEDAGYKVVTAINLEQSRKILSESCPDAIILDIMLPDGLGIDLLIDLRSQGSKIPVLLLSAWGKTADITRGLRAGANDYITKPFEYEVLLARVEAMFRNVQQFSTIVFKGPIKLNILSSIGYINDVDMLLTQKEFALLFIFIQNEGRKLTAEYIFEQVWGQKLIKGSNNVKVAVSRLRKKLENSGYTIVAYYGDGYSFEKDGS